MKWAKAYTLNMHLAHFINAKLYTEKNDVTKFIHLSRLFYATL